MTTELITHSLQQWHFVRGRVLVSMHHAASRLCDNGEALRLVQHAQMHYAPLSDPLAPTYADTRAVFEVKSTSRDKFQWQPLE